MPFDNTTPAASTFRVTVQDILPMLAMQARIIEKRNAIPILANVLFKGDGTTVVTDLDMELTYRIAGADTGFNPFTVPLATLQKAVKGASKGGFVEFEVTKDTVMLTVDGLRSTVSTLPAEDFPIDIPMYGNAEPIDFRMLQSDFYDWFSFIAPCISTEETRYYLNGILVHAKDGRLCGVATDGHRLALRDAGDNTDGYVWNADEDTGNRGGDIIPAKTVKFMLLATGAKATGQMSLSLGSTGIRFTTKEFTLRSKCIDGTFPDYTRVIPKDHKEHTAVSPTELHAAITRIVNVTNKSQAIKMQPSEGKVSAQFEGELHDMQVAFSGSPADGSEFGVNAAYIQEACKMYAGLDAVVVNIGFDNGSPMLITAVGVAGLRVIMPVRV